MTYDVLVTRKANKFIARVRQWPVIVVEGESETEVLRQHRLTCKRSWLGISLNLSLFVEGQKLDT